MSHRIVNRRGESWLIIETVPHPCLAERSLRNVFDVRTTRSLVKSVSTFKRDLVTCRTRSFPFFFLPPLPPRFVREVSEEIRAYTHTVALLLSRRGYDLFCLKAVRRQRLLRTLDSTGFSRTLGGTSRDPRVTRSARESASVPVRIDNA